MSTTSRVLPVPYFVQPNAVTCQSTVLKMMASYLENQVIRASTGGGTEGILKIWADINQDPNRPIKGVLNSHANMMWWPRIHFPSLGFQELSPLGVTQALDEIVRHIDRNYPVIACVNHAGTTGHIILIIGYENYQPLACTADFDIVVHDPFGAFDPSLRSRYFGSSRWTGGASLVAGGESGPGKGVRVPIQAASRESSQTYDLISVA